MTELTTTERRAIEAVARHVSAPWEQGANPPDGVLTLAGRTIALAIAVWPGLNAGRDRAAPARLREDRVAQRVLSALDAEIEARGPDGRTVILTLGAPIMVPNQTLAALTPLLLDRLAGGVDTDEKADIFGNRVRLRILDAGAVWTSKLVGFVFTGDPPPGDLANDVRGLRDAIATTAAEGRPDGFDAWWLVFVGGNPIADAKTYRHALSRTAVLDGFETILMVSDGGRIEALVG